MPVAQPVIVTAPASSSATTSAPPVKLGASLIGATTTSNTSSVVSPPSLAVRVTVAVPNWSVAGVTVTVRDPPVPARAIAASGTIVVSEDAAVTVTGSPSESATVNARAPVAPSSSIAWSSMALIDGGSLTSSTVMATTAVSVKGPPSPVAPWSSASMVRDAGPLYSAVGV